MTLTETLLSPASNSLKSKMQVLEKENDRFRYPSVTPYPNAHGLSILDKQDGKGRGVYASQPLKRGTLLSVSPALVLSKEEYSRPGGVGASILKDYVFTWDRQGQMAVALGLGSLFNHSQQPNVSYVLDKTNKTINYMLTKDVGPDEELCIFYGQHAKFGKEVEFEAEEETLDGWDGLSGLNLVDEEATQERFEEAGVDPNLNLDPTELVPFQDCPCVRVTNEISLADLPLELVEAWVSDVVAKDAPALFDHIRASRKARGWPVNYNSHLKRIKRLDDERLAVLLMPPNEHDFEDTLDFINKISTHPAFISSPYQTSVPARPAATREQLTLFNEVWPVNFVPVRTGVNAQILPKGLTRAHIDWIQTMVNRVERLGQDAMRRGELPIASLVASSSSSLGPPLAEAHDTRQSTGNFLCHSIANLIDQVAALDLRNARQVPDQPPPYLLSGLTLFTTHEPCMMCSMALLHSRIAVVYYVRPAPEAGGLGSVLSVHEDRGLNHKFEAWRWIGKHSVMPDVQVDP